MASVHRIAARYLRRVNAGANSFQNYGAGTDLQKVFREVSEDAAHEHGHGGYTGTIAEKHTVKLRSSTPMTHEEAQAFISKDIESNDKWGPAYAVPICEAKEGAPKTIKLVIQADDQYAAKRKASDQAMAMPAKAGQAWKVKSVKATLKKDGKPPAVTKEPLEQQYFLVQDMDGNQAVAGKFEAKADAIKALASEFATNPRSGRPPSLDGEPSGPRPSYKIVQVKELMKITPTEDPEPAKWDVEVEMTSMIKGKTVGYMFYGYASS